MNVMLPLLLIAYGRFPVSEENKFSGDKVAIQVCFPNGKLNNNVLNFW